ncbi:MAG: CBS domain-containing protein, partial [Acidobacteriota bacterium]
PVVDSDGRLDGVVTRTDLGVLARALESGAAADLAAVMHTAPAVAHPDEPLRIIVHRMAETGLTRFPVVERGTGRRLLGMIALEDLLKARAVHLEAEQRRERIRTVRIAFPFGLAARNS